MRLKPKTARRLFLLGAACLALMIAFVGLFFVRSWQNERRTRQLRADGMAAYASRDYWHTLDNLGRYLRREADDREAWLAFADARERVEDPKAAHLQKAAMAFARAFALDESDRQTALKVVTLQNLIGYSAEARDQAARLRPAKLESASVEHADAMTQEAIARVTLKAFDATLDALTARLIELRPTDYQAAQLRLAFLRGAERGPDALAFALQRLEADPTSPGAQMLALTARAESGASVSSDEVISLLCSVAGVSRETAARVAEPTYTEPQLTAQLFSAFDRLGMYPHAAMVIRDAATRLNDADYRRLLARRLWQMGRSQDLLSDFPATKDAEHSEVLAFRALAQHSTGKADDAAATLGELRAREHDFAAKAWAAALDAVLNTPDAKTALSQIDGAIREHDGEPTFQHLRAEVLTRLGRGEEARTAWTDLYKHPLADGWDTPAVRVIETLLDEGRIDEAMHAARTAVQRFPSALAVALSQMRVQAQLIESGRPITDPAATLTSLEAIAGRIDGQNNKALSQLAYRALTPARVTLLAASGRREEAVQVIERLISQPDALDSDLAQRLARVSARARLGLEDRLLGAAVTGDTLLSRALLMHAEGDADAAAKLIDDAIATATPDSRAELMTVQAQFRDETQHPEALASWKACVQAFPESLPIHLAAIRSNAAAEDSAFVEQVAARVIQLGGSDADRPSADIRFARARALLAGSLTTRTRDEAVAMLRALVLEAPARADYRDLLVNALLLDRPSLGIAPKFQEAIDQLNAAAAFASDRGAVTLRLAEIYRQQSQPQRAVAELSKLASDPSASATSRLRAVDLLGEFREFEAALKGLEPLLAGEPDDTSLLLRRGGLLLALRRDREAIETYTRLSRAPLTDPATILSVATALRSLGEQAAADAALSLLDAPEIAPLERALARGAHYAAQGEAERALAEFTRATELAPAEGKAWAALSRFQLERGDTAAAEATVARGLTNAPESTELKVLREQLRLAAAGDEADITALAEALSQNPATARRAEAIRAIDAARAAGNLDNVAALGRIADEFADDPSTQVFLARRLATNPPGSLAMSEAMRIMRRASMHFAADPVVQETAARVLISAADWEGALPAANAWRALTRDPRADVAVAEVHLALNRTKQALDAVAGHRLPANITPDDSLSLGVLLVRARAAAEAGGPAAYRVVEPYVSNATVRRGVMLPIASFVLKSQTDIAAWIDAAAANTDPAAADDLLAVAESWAAAAKRVPSAHQDFLRRAAAIVDTVLQQGGEAANRALQMKSSIAAAAGNMADAVAIARQSVQTRPEDGGAKLALARLLLASADGAAEAESILLPLFSQKSIAPEAMLLTAQAQHMQAEAAGERGDAAQMSAKRQEAQATLALLAAIDALPTALLVDMANLAERLRDDRQAAALYERILASPEPPRGRALAILKNNLAFLLYKQSPLGTANDGLRRAKLLAEEAISIERLGAFFDTLGSIEAALGDRSAAVTAFRTAVQLDVEAPGPRLNLAELLAGGSAAEQSEARSILSTFTAPTGDAELEAQLTRVREQLSSK